MRISENPLHYVLLLCKNDVDILLIHDICHEMNIKLGSDLVLALCDVCWHFMKRVLFRRTCISTYDRSRNAVSITRLKTRSATLFLIRSFTGRSLNYDLQFDGFCVDIAIASSAHGDEILYSLTLSNHYGIPNA